MSEIYHYSPTNEFDVQCEELEQESNTERSIYNKDLEIVKSNNCASTVKYVATLAFILVLVFFGLDYREKQHLRGERYYKYYYERIAAKQTESFAVSFTVPEGATNATIATDSFTVSSDTNYWTTMSHSGNVLGKVE
jgi:hypothetical protein